MIKALVSDFSRVILFPKDRSYEGSLNGLHKELSGQDGYQIMDHFEVNVELLDLYKSLKPEVRLYIFTSDAIQDAPEFGPLLQPVFEGIFSAAKLGIKKSEAEAYRTICNELKLLPEEILYVDDVEENVEAANEAGWRMVKFEGNGKLFESLRGLL